MCVRVSVCLCVREPEGNGDLFRVGGCFSCCVRLLVIGFCFIVKKGSRCYCRTTSLCMCILLFAEYIYTALCSLRTRDQMKGRLDPASAESRASASAFEPECQILTCTKLGRLPVSPPSLRSHLSPLFFLSHPSLFILELEKKSFVFFSFTTFQHLWGGNAV